MHALIEAIDAELPQTQCGKCGYPGCRPYAEAIANGEAINRCPPGGEATVVRLAELAGREPQPLEQPAQSPLVAFVREAECIGCTKCIQACPVDAILGAAKQMHTVIIDECTGCELCVAPCPVDCIDLLPHPHWQTASNDAERESYLARRAAKGRRRFLARNRRLAAEADRKRQAKRLETARPTAPTLSASALRANRIRVVAVLKRLTRQQDDPRLSSEERNTLAQRIQEHQAQLTTLDHQLATAPTTPSEVRRAPTEHQRRMAINAAKQALRKAQQQLAHAERQQDSEAEHAARHQIDQASRMLNDAQHTLDVNQAPR